MIWPDHDFKYGPHIRLSRGDQILKDNFFSQNFVTSVAKYGPYLKQDKVNYAVSERKDEVTGVTPVRGCS